MSKAGGLSFTGRLSDFSLYIFHPYGGAQRKMASPTYASSDSTYKLGTSFSFVCFQSSRPLIRSLSPKAIGCPLIRPDFRCTEMVKNKYIVPIKRDRFFIAERMAL